MIEYRLFFQRRSGGHAIVEWIASHFKKPGVLLNSLRPNVKWNLSPTKYWNAEYPIQKIKNEKDLKKHEKGRLRIRRKFVITTYEDPLRYFDSLYTNQIEGVNSNKIIPIIVIRDIYNNSASRLKFDGRRKKSQPPGWYDESLNHWKDLFLTKLFGKFFIEINYNRWLLSKVYRLRMARCLKLPNNDGHLNTTIHNFGGGSSFTGTRATAKQKMLLRRWEMYIEEFGITPTFQKILNDDELREINLLFFGWALNKKGGIIR
jgi:hypothetical protein